MPNTISPAFHEPALAKEVISLLAPFSPGRYLDGTVGGGGHARRILEASAPGGTVYGLDRDAEALAAASQALKSFGDRVMLRQGNFRAAGEIYRGVGFDGILLDLGISSHQIDTASRGFSFDREGPVDMRMDRGEGRSATELLAGIEESELVRVLSTYGESVFSRRIAREIIRERATRPLYSTSRLAEVVRRAVPQHSERKSVAQVFQALRIMVNDEIGALEEGLEELFSVLLPHGRLAVISYHSLEDRAVKTFFSGLADPCICPPDFPVCACGKVPAVRLLTRKPIRPSEAEVESNPRSRSARLRAAEKLEVPATGGTGQRQATKR
ncbi:MAG: 16S rRNA (cytosine(1402)-N(4))-methyltransferase [Candidatus Glassbacteria bacterium RIFCSPLOWO2_12_FULL_58_11]|uniref:Ribosomal RNA small subunit methyltransferase H n=1 Tax=Candidatus Glassbacteria bacterium RIFCSPLOWO2_12_FULL_58_11 TaxID=1817867 RepID=A0A1F5Z2K9_9BACT|nr:MAG: 16S rRNA (cytosine(1402)-N(4))-methyltransferase [Candidatus Glassbacteria bacterium RIFCSPLOWO2_12_FULL_58_11]